MPNKDSITRLMSLACAALAGAALLWLGVPSRAQQVAGIEGQRIRVQLENHAPPFQAQVKRLLEGDRAEQSGGHILFTGARVKDFNTNGALEMVIRSPQCILDVAQRTVSSTGVLHIQIGDGRFQLQGRGFLLQTNGTLHLSNQVQTLVRMPSNKSPVIQ